MEEKQSAVNNNKLLNIPASHKNIFSCYTPIILRFLLSGKVEYRNSVKANRSENHHWRWTAGWTSTKIIIACILTCFMASLVMDLLDLFGDGPSNEPSYGKVRNIISMIAYADTQIVLFRICVILLFVLLRGKQIIACLNFVIGKTAVGFSIPGNVLKRYMMLAHALFIISLIGTLANLAGKLTKPSAYENFWRLERYGFMSAPYGVIFFVLHVPVSIGSILFAPPMIILFAYLTSILHACAQSIEQQFTAILQEIEEVNVESSVLTVKLKRMREQYESLLEMTQEVQSIFTVKLLADIVTNVFEILVFTAWLLIWFVVPEGNSVYDCPGKFGVTLVALGNLWMLGGKPLQQSAMPGKLALLVEDFICMRHCQIRKDAPVCVPIENVEKVMLGVASVSSEEREVCYEFLHRLKTSSLTFHAGDLLELDYGSVLTATFFVFGFFCFVVNQIESFVPSTRSLVIDAVNCTATWQ
ncbi:uncharacterized protein LOC129586848 [Paramacrobiotus metropolitanus]|uniref:uncharacterized protein LOC129586848 n=1 Tax=Paramacrobiotus metropolitanus TaxID=2943436 RepID=UPI0024455FD2|nr:uncharacterized protein LOC129586848 [Paramacrobiotus metropolitanus]